MKRIKLATKYIYFRRKFTNEKETDNCISGGDNYHIRQEPETPQNPDEQEPETPQNPDEQNSETPDNNQNNNENNNQNENNSQNNNENTSQNNNSSETNNSQDDSTGKQPPKTGDPTSFASLYALAGRALAGIGAVKLKFRKRK